MIEARSLSKTYGDKTAVDDVSFTVRPGIATTLVLTIPAVLIAFLVGQAILSSQHIQASFSDPGVARAVVGAALYLTVVGMLGLGLGALVRSTARRHRGPVRLAVRAADHRAFPPEELLDRRRQVLTAQRRVGPAHRAPGPDRVVPVGRVRSVLRLRRGRLGRRRHHPAKPRRLRCQRLGPRAATPANMSQEG